MISQQEAKEDVVLKAKTWAERFRRVAFTTESKALLQAVETLAQVDTCQS